jgi:hypothetical protein
MPPLPTQASPALLEAIAARRPSRFRPIVASLALFAAGAATFALWPSVSDWVVTLAGRSSKEATVTLSHATKQEAGKAEVRAPAPSAEPPSTLAQVSVTTTELAAAPAEVISPVSEKRAPRVTTATDVPSLGAVVVAAPEPPRPNERESDDAAKVAPEQAQAAAEPSGASSSAPAEGDAAEVAPLGPFDTTAAVTALSVAALQSGSCRKAGDPTGMARVVVTFAPSGRVTSSTVSGAPFAGTSTGGCIAGQFRAARVPPFDGPMVTVAKSVVVQ